MGQCRVGGAAVSGVTWRCGHERTLQNTHGGTARTHAQCWTCRRRSQQRADAKYRSTLKGAIAQARAEQRRRVKYWTDRRWADGQRAAARKRSRAHQDRIDEERLAAWGQA